MAVLRRTFLACADSVAEVRHAAVGFARGEGAGELLCQNIALAVSEAASNVVVHAYRDDESRQGEIELELTVEGGFLDVVVRDAGVGMAPRTDSPGLGLGMPLIANLADRVEITSLEAGGTEVSMRFAACAACDV